MNCAVVQGCKQKLSSTKTSRMAFWIDAALAAAAPSVASLAGVAVQYYAVHHMPSLIHCSNQTDPPSRLEIVRDPTSPGSLRRPEYEGVLAALGAAVPGVVVPDSAAALGVAALGVVAPDVVVPDSAAVLGVAAPDAVVPDSAAALAAAVLANHQPFFVLL